MTPPGNVLQSSYNRFHWSLKKGASSLEPRLWLCLVDHLVPRDHGEFAASRAIVVVDSTRPNAAHIAVAGLFRSLSVLQPELCRHFSLSAGNLR